jgi:hypothetical protein
LIQVYALIATVCFVCLLNYYTFRSFYTEFDERFRSTMGGVKQMMMEANREMEELFKDMIMKGEEPQDLVDFGEAWRDRLQALHELEEERDKMNSHIMFLYYLLVFGLVFAVFDLLNPGPIMILLYRAIHLHFFGWIFTILAGVLLVLNYRVYLKLVESLKANQTVVIKVRSVDPVEDDMQVYRIHTIQDDPMPVEQ